MTDEEQNGTEPRTWVEENIDDVECVLCWSSEHAILNYDGKQVLFHTVDRTILFLEELLIQKNQSGVFVYPVTRTEVAIPMCVEALYSLMPSEKKRKKVLLISQNVAVRELYHNLKANYMRLNEVFPLGIIKMDGSVKPQIKTSDTKLLRDVKCKFLHTSNPKFLPSSEITKDIGCVIIDADDFEQDTMESIFEWTKTNKIPTVIALDNNPNTEHYEIYNSLDIPIWGWNAASLHDDFQADLTEIEKNPEQYSNPFSFSIFHIRNLLTGVKREFIEVDDAELRPVLKEALQLYFDIKQICRETKNDALSRALATYASCKYAFERNLAPIQDVEAECQKSFLAKTFEKRIQTLEWWEKILSKHNIYFGTFWSKTYGIAKVLLHKLAEYGNPKYDELKALVKKAVQEKERVLIINYSEPFARAVTVALCRDFSIDADTLAEKGIIVSSIAGKMPTGEYDKCVIFGQIPFRASWLLRTACAKDIIFLVYPSEKALLKYQFEIEEKKISTAFGTGTRVGFLKRILGKDQLTSMPKTTEEDEAQTIPLKLSKAEEREEEKFASLWNDLEIDEELIADEDVDTGDEDELEESIVSEDGTLVVKCCKIITEDDGVMYFKRSRKLPIFKAAKRLAYLDAGKVKAGDLLIVVKDNIRNNLADEILEKAHRHPRMQDLKFLVNSWVIALRNGMVENKDDAHDFLTKLNKAQDVERCPKVTNWLTIQLWKEGYVIGPQNLTNIKLIGKIYNQQFLVDHYKQIGVAIRRLRGIHQKLLRKFNEMVLRAGLKHAQGAIEDELIDEEFNLHIEDFADIISIEKIKEIVLESSTEKGKLDKIMRRIK